MKKEKLLLTDHCQSQLQGVIDAQDLFKGKWKIVIVATLFYVGKIKFMDLQRQMATIAPKVLSKELKDLEMNALISRTVCDTAPITVEYELTALGKSFGPIITAMGAWGVSCRNLLITDKEPRS